MSDQELLPCPFCGQPPLTSRHPSTDTFVRCSSPFCFMSATGTIAEIWNTRADHIVDANKKVGE